MRKVDITNKRFGRLVAVRYTRSSPKEKKAIWLCKCDCGKEIETLARTLISGHTKSCGCLKEEVLLNRITKHGFARTKFYTTFHSLKKRCNKITCLDYKDYGGRGIQCEWKLFEEFRDDMYEGYLKAIKDLGDEKNVSIERINVNGNYCKENCCWIHINKQQRNTRNTIRLTYEGKTKTLSEWINTNICIKNGLNSACIKNRIKLKWPNKKIFNTKNRQFKT